MKTYIKNSDHIISYINALGINEAIGVETQDEDIIKMITPINEIIQNISTKGNLGRKFTQEHKDKIAKAHLGKKQHISEAERMRRVEYGKTLTGSKNPNAKIYKITSPSGKVHIIKGEFGDFCKEHNLSVCMFYKYRNKIVPCGKNQGWKANW